MLRGAGPPQAWKQGGIPEDVGPLSPQERGGGQERASSGRGPWSEGEDGEWRLCSFLRNAWLLGRGQKQGDRTGGVCGDPIGTAAGWDQGSWCRGGASHIGRPEAPTLGLLVRLLGPRSLLLLGALRRLLLPELIQQVFDGERGLLHNRFEDASSDVIQDHGAGGAAGVMAGGTLGGETAAPVPTFPTRRPAGPLETCPGDITATWRRQPLENPGEGGLALTPESGRRFCRRGRRT